MKKKKYSHLSEKERFVIEKLFVAGVRLREIARFLLRSPNTVSREVSKNSVNGMYLAVKANHRAYFKRWRSKRQCMKVAMDQFLCRFVEKKLREKWSPEQICRQEKFKSLAFMGLEQSEGLSQEICLEDTKRWKEVY